MTTEQKLDQILSTLTGFIQMQERFNTNQLEFNTNQLEFNKKQEAFNKWQIEFNEWQTWFNQRIETSVKKLEVWLDALRQDFSEFKRQEELQHNVTHRLIMQAFEHISELQNKHPWEK